MYRLLLAFLLLAYSHSATLAASDDARAVTWEKITQEEPNPAYAVEANIVHTKQEIARMGGWINERSLRHSAEQTRYGTTQYERQTWLAEGSSVRKDVSFSEIITLPGAPSKKTISRESLIERDGVLIHIFKGRNEESGVYAEVRGSASEPLFQADEEGTVLRCLLLAKPLRNILHSSLIVSRKQTPEGTVLTLKKTVPRWIWGEAIPIPRPLRLTVSKDGTRLLNIEQLDYYKDRVVQTIRPAQWDRLAPDVWFPRVVRVISYSNTGDGERDAYRTETYRRVAAAAGKTVHTASLHDSTFAGRTSVRDGRFDTANPDIYTADREPKPRAEVYRRYEKRHRERVLSSFIPQTVLLFAVGGSFVAILFKIRRGE